MLAISIQSTSLLKVSGNNAVAHAAVGECSSHLCVVEIEGKSRFDAADIIERLHLLGRLLDFKALRVLVRLKMISVDSTAGRRECEHSSERCLARSRE